MSGFGRGPHGHPLVAGDPPYLGGYVLLARLGEGGMGRVYLARSPDGRVVAVKVIRTDVADVEGFRRRFRSEVERARQVPPFCTAEVLDADPDHEPPYLVVEYVDGPELTTVVRERGPLSPANLYGLAIGVATALTAIHGAGIVHRDLKPSNVLLAPGSPKVIDFGLARAVGDDGGASGVTRPNEVIGAVSYLAPERIAPGTYGELTAAVDVFAWGAIVAYAGTGRRPFEADSPQATAARILTQPPNLDGLGGTLRSLVEQTLAKDPAQRPTARDLLDRLLAEEPARTAGGLPVPNSQPAGPGRAELIEAGRRRAQVDVPTPAGANELPPSTVPDLPKGWPRPRRRRRGLAIAAVVLGAIVTAGIIGVLLNVLPVGSGTDPEPSASPTPAGEAAPPPPDAVPAGAQLVVQDRLGAEGNWDVSGSERFESSCTFDGGLLVTSDLGASYRCLGPRDRLTTLAVFVDVTLVEPGSCASVWFRYTDAGGGYALRICEDGYHFGTHQGPAPETLRQFRREIPLGTPTRVGVSADAGTIRLYQDGQPVGEVSDSTFDSGETWLGLLQAEGEPRYQVKFTDVQIWGRSN